jgi:exo-1,4-beta-D-glucosaminidase
VNVTLKTDLVNHSQKTVQLSVNGTITPPPGSKAGAIIRSVELKPGESRTVSVKVSVENASIWWPASWGAQPLYTVQANLLLHDKTMTISDKTQTQQFGIRQVSSYVNQHNDTAFVVNGEPFQVMGAGYGPDMFMRFDEGRVEKIFQYMLDMGLNTVRLEGKQEHPELYELADRMGMMVLAGWECCDKWEGWKVRLFTEILITKNN